MKVLVHDGQGLWLLARRCVCGRSPSRARPGPRRHLGGPVVDVRDRGAPVGIQHSVCRAGQRHTEPDMEPRLFTGLTRGGDLEGLTGVDLALSPRPVVVFRAMHEGDFEHAARHSPRHRAGGVDPRHD